MAWACMASSGTGLMVFIDDLTEDKSSRINSKMYRDILSAQIQSNAAKSIGRRLTQKFLKVKSGILYGIYTVYKFQILSN